MAYCGLAGPVLVLLDGRNTNPDTDDHVEPRRDERGRSCGNAVRRKSHLAAVRACVHSRPPASARAHDKPAPFVWQVVDFTPFSGSKSLILLVFLVPLAGIEPALLAESDFESDASTSS